MGLIGSVKQRAGVWLLNRTMRNGIDLRKLRFLPSAITLPLKRDGLDPLPELMATQAEEPVKKMVELFGRGVWVVSGYEAAREVLAGDADTWSNDLGQFVSQEGRGDEEQIGGLGMIDPPLHTTLRRYLTPEFTMRRLARLQPGIESIVSQRLDAMAAAAAAGNGIVDMVQEFAFAVPFDVICDLLGLPVDDRARFLELGVARFDLSEGGAGAFGAQAHTREFLINAVKEQRENPGDGLIGALLKEHGEELDDLTLGGIADGVFLGGYETSASMLALGAYLIATTPEAGRMLRSDPESVNKVIEELLRHLCVVQLAFLRFAKRDVEVAGTTIKEGDAVGVSLMAANRDPELAPDLDTFDPTRDPARHLAFGWGMHRCVGAELARMELRTSLRMLAERFPDLAMAASIDDLEFRKLSAVYGVEALPVRLTSDDLAAAPAQA